MKCFITLFSSISAFSILKDSSNQASLDEAYCQRELLSYHPNPPIPDFTCVNTTEPCAMLEQGIRFCKKGSTDLWRLVRCEPGFELHVTRIQRSNYDILTKNLTLSDIEDEENDRDVHFKNEYYWGSCHDIDECQMGESVHACSHICSNTIGSYICKCPLGFALARDGKTCLSIAKSLMDLFQVAVSDTIPNYISENQL